jgi:hypothetical protein
MTEWGETLPDAKAAVVEFAGRTHRVEVKDGFFLFTAWSVPEGATFAELVGFE